jgi:outer membrane receptor protein involved in Fe transport
LPILVEVVRTEQPSGGAPSARRPAFGAFIASSFASGRAGDPKGFTHTAATAARANESCSIQRRQAPGDQSSRPCRGDAGVTFPSGSTTRTGIEWGNAYHINDWLTADLNAAFTRARFDGNSQPGGRYLPNSPSNVIDAGLTAQRASGWFGALRVRHFGQVPLVEDNSAKSPAYTTVDAQIGFREPGQWLVALDVFNIADVKWNDIEYYYASRLRGEASPHADHVLHPGAPRTLRARFQINF